MFKPLHPIRSCVVGFYCPRNIPLTLKRCVPSQIRLCSAQLQFICFTNWKISRIRIEKENILGRQSMPLKMNLFCNEIKFLTSYHNNPYTEQQFRFEYIKHTSKLFNCLIKSKETITRKNFKYRSRLYNGRSIFKNNCTKITFCLFGEMKNTERKI